MLRCPQANAVTVVEERCHAFGFNPSKALKKGIYFTGITLCRIVAL